MPRLLPLALAPAALLLLLAACGSSEGDPADGTVSCEQDPRLDAYAGQLDKAGERGLLFFHFSDLEPAPPAKGSNTFHVRVSDAAGAPMQGALEVDLRMPDHGHGTSVEPVVSFDDALGRYTITPLFLFMPGVWRIEFDAYSSADADAPEIDRVALHFCVEG